MRELPKLVSDRLLAPGISEHPDADLLAAFAESSLAVWERNRVLNHLSTCAKCRQVVALAALPEPFTDRSPVALERSSSWLRTPVLRWGTLVACVVVAAAFLIYKTEQAPRRVEIQAALQQPLPGAPAIQAQRKGPVSADNRILKSGAKAKARHFENPSASSAPERMDALNKLTTPPNVAASANAASSDSARSSETVDVQAGGAIAHSEGSVQADEGLSGHNPAAPAKNAPLFVPRPTTETAASTVGGAAKLKDLRAPDWRLSPDDGLPERSFAAGHWEKVQVDHRTGFRAISAQGMEVWIGGPGGLLYHSEDMGLNWTRAIAVSSGATLTDDITGITFNDHLHGKIQTAGGQIWLTSDAGKTWEVR